MQIKYGKRSMEENNIKNFKQLVYFTLKCKPDEVKAYTYKYSETDIPALYSHHKLKEDKIKEYLKDCKDITNTSTFEPFVRYYEEFDEFIETDLDIIRKYLTLDNIGDIVNNTGLYIKK